MKLNLTPAPLLASTNATARLLGIGPGALRSLARTVPGFPQPIGTRKYGAPDYWPVDQVREFIERATSGQSAA